MATAGGCRRLWPVIVAEERGGWLGEAWRREFFPAERSSGLRKGGDESSGGDRERPARWLLPVDESREMRASFERQNDFLVVREGEG